MGMWFQELGRFEDPGPEQVAMFLEELDRLLHTLVSDDDLIASLWRGDSGLRDSARTSFKEDIRPALKDMRNRLVHDSGTIEAAGDELTTGLKDHGLVGVSARFKYQALAKIARGWRKYRGHLTVGTGFRRVMEGVDAILDSVVSVVGAGGAVKEFKDIIMALAPSSAGD